MEAGPSDSRRRIEPVVFVETILRKRSIGIFAIAGKRDARKPRSPQKILSSVPYGYAGQANRRAALNVTALGRSLRRNPPKRGLFFAR